MLRGVYSEQLKTYLSEFNDPYLNTFIPYIDPFFANEKHTLYQLVSYKLKLVQSRPNMEVWINTPKHDFGDIKSITGGSHISESDTGETRAFLNYLKLNPNVGKDKFVFFVGSDNSALPIAFAKRAANVGVYDKYSDNVIDLVLNSIKNNVYVHFFHAIDMSLRNNADIFVCVAGFNEKQNDLVNILDYLETQELQGKDLYIMSHRIANGIHPKIKIDNLSVVHSETIDGYNRVIFNSIKDYTYT